MITVEKREEIRRAYYVEKKSIRQISRELEVSRPTIRKAVTGAASVKYELKQPRSAPKLGAYKEKIEALLTENERLPGKQRYTSSKIYDIIWAEGYRGAQSTLRHYIGQRRKVSRRPKVYLPLEFDPGTDAQVDWGEADVIMSGEQITVQLLVVRLNYSRRLFVMAFPSQKQESFFEGQVQAFHHFGGVPQRITYDNLKAAVKKVLRGKKREEQERFIIFRSHYLFQSHFCAPRAGNEKGGVEHGVGYARRNFLVPLPQVDSFAQLNAYLLDQCLADDGRQVTGQPTTIYQAWPQEQPQLQPLPAYDFACCRSLEVTLTPYSQVVIETNRYSVPTDKAVKKLVVKLYSFHLEIYRPDQKEPLAVHPRCYERGQDVFEPLHYLPLLQQRPGAFDHAKPLRRWRKEWPLVYEQLLAHLQAQARDGEGIREFIRVLSLHQEHPAKLVEQAIGQALTYGCTHADGVTLCLNQLLQPETPLVQLDLSDQPHLATVGDQIVDLGLYDQLLQGAHVN